MVDDGQIAPDDTTFQLGLEDGDSIDVVMVMPDGTVFSATD